MAADAPCVSPARSDAETWLTAKEAAGRLGVSRKTLARLGDDRKLTRRSVPGGTPKYLGREVERLVALSTTEAVDPGAVGEV